MTSFESVDVLVDNTDNSFIGNLTMVDVEELRMLFVIFIALPIVSVVTLFTDSVLNRLNSLKMVTTVVTT